MRDITPEMLATDVVVTHEPIPTLTWPDGTTAFFSKPNDADRAAQIWRAAIGLRAITGGPPINPAMTLLQEISLKISKLLVTPMDEVDPSVRAYIAAGRKIEAVKQQRTISGMNLVAARDYVEAHWNDFR